MIYFEIELRDTVQETLLDYEVTNAGNDAKITNEEGLEYLMFLKRLVKLRRFIISSIIMDVSSEEINSGYYKERT